MTVIESELDMNLIQPPHPFPEAGGVAFTDLYLPDGGRIGITARDTVPGASRVALDELMATIEYAKANYDLTTSVNGFKPTATATATAAPDSHVVPVATTPGIASAPPVSGTTYTPQAVAPQVQAAPGQGNGVGQATQQVIEVSSLTKEFTSSGKPVLKVRGGPFMKYGVFCWLEVAELYVNLEGMEGGIAYDATPETRYAVCSTKPDGKVGKVLSFQATP